MATKLYTTGTLHPDTLACPGLGSDPSFADGATNGYGGTTARLLSTAHGSFLIGDNRTSVTGPKTLITPASGEEWISYPITSSFTLSGTVTFNFWGTESSMNANAGMWARIMRLTPTGTLDLISDSSRGVELGTATAVQNWTATPTSTSINKGDRIVLWVGFADAGGTMASGFTLAYRHAGTTDAADGDSYISFTETFSFDSSASSPGTQLFLTDTASDVVIGGSVDEKEAWTSRGSGFVNAIVNTAAGPTSPIQVTSTAGGNTIEWYTKRLQAFTLSGKITANIRSKTSASSGSATVIEVAVVNADGSSPTIFCSQSAMQNAPTIGLVDTAEKTFQSGPDISVSDGQRLRIRIYIDDNYGTPSTAPMSSGKTCTFTYNSNSGGVAGDSYIILTESVSEYIASTEIPSAMMAPMAGY